MNKGDWMNVLSVEDLKEWGTLKEVKALLKESWKEDQLVSGNSFEQLFKKVKAIQDMVKQNQVESKITHKAPTPATYFANEASEYLFYLLELEGELRMKKLAIHRPLFSDKQKAKKWYRQIAKIIHPDHCAHPNATRGMEILNDLYAQMIED